MPAQPGNKTASKPADERACSTVQLRCLRREKAAWVRAAAGRKLSDWIREHLNKAAL